jgi:hypothetical protein
MLDKIFAGRKLMKGDFKLMTSIVLYKWNWRESTSAVLIVILLGIPQKRIVIAYI